MMKFTISAGEGRLYDGEDVVVDFGAVYGATIKDLDGRELVGVSGSDEFDIEVDWVVSAKIVYDKEGHVDEVEVMVSAAMRGKPELKMRDEIREKIKEILHGKLEYLTLEEVAEKIMKACDI